MDSGGSPTKSMGMDYAELDTPALQLQSTAAVPLPQESGTVSKAKFEIIKDQLKKFQVMK